MTSGAGGRRVAGGLRRSGWRGRGVAKGERRAWRAGAALGPWRARRPRSSWMCHLASPPVACAREGGRVRGARRRKERAGGGGGCRLASRLERLQVRADVREVLVAAAGVADEVDVLVGDLRNGRGVRRGGCARGGRGLHVLEILLAFVTTASSMQPPRSLGMTVRLPCPSLRPAMSPTTIFSMNFTTSFPCMNKGEQSVRCR